MMKEKKKKMKDLHPEIKTTEIDTKGQGDLDH